MSQLDPPPQVKDFNWIWLKWLNNFYEYVKSEVSGASTGITVEDEGTPLATEGDTLDFVGAGVTASGTGTTKTITIPAATVAYDVWAPVLSDGTTESTMTNQDGTYALIGDMVFITCNITVNTVGGSGAARITGLPFTAYNESAEHDYPLSVGEASSLATAANENVVVAQVENNTTYITLHLWDLSVGGATKAMTVAEVSNSGVLRLNGFYRKA